MAWLTGWLDPSISLLILAKGTSCATSYHNLHKKSDLYQPIETQDLEYDSAIIRDASHFVPRLLDFLRAFSLVKTQC